MSKAAIDQAREALAQWDELDPLREGVQEEFLQAEETGHYDQADEMATDLWQMESIYAYYLADALARLVQEVEA